MQPTFYQQYLPDRLYHALYDKYFHSCHRLFQQNYSNDQRMDESFLHDTYASFTDITSEVK